MAKRVFANPVFFKLYIPWPIKPAICGKGLIFGQGIPRRSAYSCFMPGDTSSSLNTRSAFMRSNIRLAALRTSSCVRSTSSMMPDRYVNPRLLCARRMRSSFMFRRSRTSIMSFQRSSGSSVFVRAKFRDFSGVSSR